MIRPILTAAILLASFNAAHAVRVLETVENGVELALSELRLPTSDTGNVSFSACPTCRVSVHRVTPETQYFVNGAALSLVDFLRVAGEIDAIRNGPETTLAGVFIDLQSGRVTRITLHRSAR
jgi:hypothetical protein